MTAADFELTNWRAKPALYFGGKYRIIDFPHVQLRQLRGAQDRRADAVQGAFADPPPDARLEPFSPRARRVRRGAAGLAAHSDDWYQGTADAVYQNLDIIRAEQPELVLILSGDHVYKMDYGPLLVSTRRVRADMTVCCLEVPVEEAAGTFGVMRGRRNGPRDRLPGKARAPAEIPGKPGYALASMGNYVFNTEFLYERLVEDAADMGSTHDFGHDVIPAMIETCHVQAYPFRDPETGEKAYWRDVGTLDSFWLANMELIDTTPQLNSIYEGLAPVDLPGAAAAGEVRLRR
jgi:glucose-1-phosphate adenylyltransferase